MRQEHGWSVLLGVLLAALAAPQLQAETVSDPAVLAAQAAEYAAAEPKTVVDLQQFRRTTTQPITTGDGKRGSAFLINLNPEINSWFLLKLDFAGAAGEVYHLENPFPHEQQVTLDPANPAGLLLNAGGRTVNCALWSGAGSPLRAARAAKLPFAPLCDGRLYLLNPTHGHMSNKEWVVDVLRDHFWHGEQIVGYVKSNFFADAFRHASIIEMAEAAEIAPPDQEAPAAPLIDPAYHGKSVAAPALGIRTDHAHAPKYAIGVWYPIKDLAGAYLSVLEPRTLSADLQRSLKGQTQPLDGTESAALVYLAAFNLDRFDLGFALGTDHPGVGWSGRVRGDVRNAKLPGPDGIASPAPLIKTGLVNPAELSRVRATFTGGFKRHHGAFKYAKLAMQNGGSHYGFIENGVVLSKLQPGLATLAVYSDGEVRLKTWSEDDNRGLERIRYARQNGVPLIEDDPSGGGSRPSPYVKAVGVGNWSGDEDGRLRTLRAGVCLQEQGGRRYLIYGYFSTATPAAMAQVFQACGCRYAMHLDMNALEHTYLAVYPGGAGAKVENLTTGMAELDKREHGRVVPRFAGFADNRDFFYLMEKPGGV